MSLVLNKGTAAVSAAIDGRMYSFYPGILATVDDADFQKLKKVPLIRRSLDSEMLVTGNVAKSRGSKLKEEIDQRAREEAADKGSDTDLLVRAVENAEEAVENASALVDELQGSYNKARGAARTASKKELEKAEVSLDAAKQELETANAAFAATEE